MPDSDETRTVAQTTSTLTQDQALLRVAFLVAHADGHQSEPEVEAITRLIETRLPHLNANQMNTLALEAVHDVSHFPVPEVLESIRGALGTKASRRLALHVACEVANADRRLARPETEHLVGLVGALGLEDKEVARIVRSYW